MARVEQTSLSRKQPSSLARGKEKVWFSFLKYLIAFPDRLGVSNPTSRDKLLAAVHELKLFGGSIPDERMFRSPRPKRRSLPARPVGMQEILLKGALSDSTEKGNSAVSIVDWCLESEPGLGVCALDSGEPGSSIEHWGDGSFCYVHGQGSLFLFWISPGTDKKRVPENVEETWRNARDMTATNLRHVTQTKLKLQ